MPQIINANPSFGALLGSGISSGLETLAQNKIQEMQGRAQRAQVSKGLEAIGIPREYASQVAGLPDKLQQEVVRDFLAKGGGGQTAVDQSLAALGLGQPAAQQSSGIGQLIGGPEAQQFYNQAAPQQAAQASAMQNMQSQSGLPGGQAEAPKGLPKVASLAEILARPHVTEDQKLKIAALQQKNQLAADKETAPYYKEVNKKRSAARDALITLGRQEELNKGGNLSTPAQTALIDALGHGLFGLNVDLSGLTSADSQEFRKLSYSFLRFAKDYFGGRVTNYEAKAFMQSIPTLLQSKEGRQRIINNMKTFAETDILRAEAMDRIIAENGGRRPANIESLVDTAIAPQLTEIAERFKKGLSGQSTRVNKVPAASEVPKGTNYVDPKTGKKMVSDGVSWKEATNG